MKVNAVNSNVLNNNTQKSNRKINQSNFDSVSFSSMKKNQFNGIDLAVVNKFKAPIERFDGREDLQNWCKNKIQEFNKDYKAKNEDTTVQRNAILSEWRNYFAKENKEYTPSQMLLIFDGITKNLNYDNDNIPPVLNKRVLADTIQQIEHELRADRSFSFNFGKIYANNLREYYVSDNETGNGKDYTGWIIIPSKEHDPLNFETNVEKLQALSHKSWCTKSQMAQSYLEKGDFHIYMEEGKPKLGVRFDEFDEIAEIQGEKNNTKIPHSYLDIAKKHVEEGEYYLSADAETEFREAEYKKDKINAFLEKHKDIKNYSTEQILSAVGIEYEVDKKDNKIILQHYSQPRDFSFDDIGIDENKLFARIKMIKNGADLFDSNLNNLGALEYIRGEYSFVGTKLKSLGNLRELKSEDFRYLGNVSDFDSVRKINGDVSYDTFADIPAFKDKTVILPSVRSIEGSVNLSGLKKVDLTSLEQVAGDFDISNTKKVRLDNLRAVYGDADFSNAGLYRLDKLQKVEGDVFLNNCPVKDLSSLKSADEVYLDGSSVIKIGIPGILDDDDDFCFSDSFLDDFEYDSKDKFSSYSNPWGSGYDEGLNSIIDRYRKL
ncbi:MAG: hypothetical protein IJ877_01975 [Candidatus Gastranaerophilales bacterium]|nr:hypothetical protein [Candidatus Gastranaerophilales bacterium]